MNEKYRLVYAAHEILTTQQGATALPTTGEVIQCSRSGGKTWHDWAIDMSICGDFAGGWERLVNAYLSDLPFTHSQKMVSRNFWRIVKKKKGLYANGLFIAETLGV